jgi:hypothetical protein
MLFPAAAKPPPVTTHKKIQTPDRAARLDDRIHDWIVNIKIVKV